MLARAFLVGVFALTGCQGGDRPSNPTAPSSSPRATQPGATLTAAVSASARDVRPMTRLAVGEGVPMDVALDASHVFWTDWSGRRVLKMPRDGGAVVVVAQNQKFGNKSSIAVDATSVFWMSEDPDGGMLESALWHVQKEGGTPVALARKQKALGGLALDEQDVYFTSFFGGSVVRVAKAGGPLTLLADKQDGPVGIAVDATSVYWVCKDAGKVMKMPKSGGAMVSIASGQVAPYAIVLDARGVYWTNATKAGSIARVPLGGGEVTVLATGQDSPSYLAADATYLYWSTANGVARVAKKGGAPELLAGGASPSPAARGLPQLGSFSPKGIAADAGGVFFADLAKGGALVHLEED